MKITFVDGSFASLVFHSLFVSKDQSWQIMDIAGEANTSGHWIDRRPENIETEAEDQSSGSHYDTLATIQDKQV